MYNGDNFTLVFSGVRVAQSLVFCVDRCLSYYAFSFGHYIVCHSLIDNLRFLIAPFISLNFS
jgi:hypothetical protein